jgi:type II secretory pathway component PulM
VTTLLAWWRELAARERWLLGGGGAVLVATALFLFALEPLNAQRARLQAQLGAETRSLATLRGLVAEAAALRARNTGVKLGALPAEQSLLAVLNNQARLRDVQDKVQRITPNGAREASVVFDGVEFMRLALWLIDLRQTYGIEAQRVVVDAAEDAGRVNANLTLSATNATR